MKQTIVLIIFFMAVFAGAYFHADVNAQSKIKVNVKASIGAFVLNGSLSFDPNKGGYIKSYRWKKLKGGICNIVSPDSAITVVNNIHKGSYEFVLKVVSSEGLSDSDSTSIIVNVE